MITRFLNSYLMNFNELFILSNLSLQFLHLPIVTYCVNIIVNAK